MLGTTLGSYRIESELGRGGMGAVYVGAHVTLGRKTAVKVLPPETSRDAAMLQRFFNEAKAASSIDHPGIIEVYDVGSTEDGCAYLVMELLEGESLADRLRTVGRLPLDRALEISRQVAEALVAAHGREIVHRDLKPDNVFLVPNPSAPGGEQVKLLDFGIAKLAADGQAQLTQTGALMGTPLYMSPEQCRGAKLVDARSDLYSLGCMLFQMVCGRVPFSGEGIGEIIAAHIHVAAPDPRLLAPDAPAAVVSLIGRLLAKSPDDRPQTALELASELAAMDTSMTAEVAVAAAPTVEVSAPARGDRRWLRWWLLPVVGAVAGGALSYVVADKRSMYRSYATLFYEERLGAPVPGNVEERFRAILLEDDQLQPVLVDPKLDPFPDEPDRGVARGKLREALDLESARERPDVFRINYTDRDPVRARAVADKLARVLLERDAKLHDDAARANLAAVITKERAATTELHKRELALADFLRRHPEFWREDSKSTTTSKDLRVALERERARIR